MSSNAVPRGATHSSASPTPSSSSSSPPANANQSRREPPRKRNRAALSCVACRERKIKCNRQVPCDQCTKRGDADLCFLDPSKRGPPPGQSKSAKVQAQIAAQDEQMAARRQLQQLRDDAAAAASGSSSGSMAPHSSDEWSAVKQRLAQLEAALASSNNAVAPNGASPVDPSSTNAWRPWASGDAGSAAMDRPGSSSSSGPLAMIKSAPDSDTEDAAMVLEGLAMSGQNSTPAKRGKCEDDVDPVATEPKHSIATYAAQNRETDLMLPVALGGTSGPSAADVTTTCQKKLNCGGDGKSYEDYVAMEAQGLDVSPAAKVCTLIGSSTSLLRPIYGPESFLGFGMGWAFPAAEAAGDLHVKGGECPGSAQREAVLRAIIRSLPRKQLANQLVSVYADRVNFLAGNVIHMPSFRREVEAFYALETVERQARVVNNVDVGWLAVYLLLITLALRFYPCEPPTHWESISHFFDGRCVHLWASAARTCLGLARYQTSQSLAVLQSILLANLSDSHAGRKVNQTMLRIAISNAQSMGLHRLGDRKQQPRAGESVGVVLRREMAKRIWYQLVFKDWSGALASNVYAIHERQFNTPLPGNYNDEDLEQAPLPPARPRHEHTDMSYSLEAFEVVKASKFHADCLTDKLMAEGSEETSDGKRAKLTCPEASRVDAAYRTVLENLPPFYAVGSEHGTKTNVEIERWLLQQMIFHHLLKLHRPALSSQPKARISCVALARSILDTQKKLRGTCTVIDRLLCNLAQSYTAAIVLLLDLLQHGREHNPAMRLIIRSEVAEALRALHHVNESNNSTRAGIQVIEALLAEEELRYQAAQAEEDAKFMGGAGKRKRSGDNSLPKKKDLLNLALRIAKAAKCEQRGACTSQQEQVERDQRELARIAQQPDGMSVDPRGGLLLPESQQELTKDALSRNLMESLFNPQPGGSLSLGGFGGNNPTYYNHLFGGAFGGAGGSESGLMHSSMVGPNGVEAELSPTDGDMAGFDLGALLSQYTENGQSPSSGSAYSGASGSNANGAGSFSDESAVGGSGSYSTSATSHNSDAGSPMLQRKTSSGMNASPPTLSDSPSHTTDSAAQGLDAFYSWVLSQGLNMRGGGEQGAKPATPAPVQPPLQQQQQQQQPAAPPVAPSSAFAPAPSWLPPFGGPPENGWPTIPTTSSSENGSAPPAPTGLTPGINLGTPSRATPSTNVFSSMFGAAAGADPSWLNSDPSSVAAWLSTPGLFESSSGAGDARG